jgi:opacity protein-like surface antigen
MKLLIASAVLLVWSAFACAQSVEIPKNELMVWGGFSPDSSTAIKAFGRTPDARFGIVSLRYSRRFNNSDRINLKYIADVTPLAVLDFHVPFSSPPDRTTAVGFGAAPLGIQANFRPRKKVQPYVGLSGGMLYFNKQVPGPLGTHFQFTANLDGGVEIRLNDKRAVQLGYKYFHVSNGNRGIINPGIDNNLFYVGYTFFGK